METGEEPVSPTGQYLSNSIISLSVIAVLESEIPIDDSQALCLLRDVFLPINSRFSSIMVINNKGEKKWRKVEVNLEDHIKVPIFPAGNSTKFYDNCLNDYISKLSMEKFPENKPLWEIHIIKYPTSQSSGNLIFKLHHSLGDGFSLMGALLSCLQRADNPSIPLSFPSAKIHKEGQNDNVLKAVPQFFTSIYNTLSDLWSSIMKVEDDLSPVRSAHPGVECLPVATITMSFSLDQIKQIKTKLGVTINDVIAGTIFLGTRVYMEAINKGSGKAKTRSLVLLNTRMYRGYKSVQEMVKPNSKLPWGNHFTFLSVSLPKLNDSDEAKDPLQFVWKARKIIRTKRSSLSVFLTAKYIQLIRKFQGPQAVAKHLRGALKYSSMGITNIMGPTEQMALASHPISGFYFVVTGAPQSLMTGIVSYMGRLRVAALIEKDFIDPEKFKSCIENAFDAIFKAACATSTPAN